MILIYLIGGVIALALIALIIHKLGAIGLIIAGVLGFMALSQKNTKTA